MDYSGVEEFSYQKSKSILRKIKIIPTHEKLTAAAGLGTLVEIFDQSGLKSEFIKCLPKRVSPRSQGSYKLALNMICGFIHGFDCLDDYDDFKGEEALKAMFEEGSPSSRTLGDFIKDFSDENIADLNRFLGRMSWSMMSSLEKNLAEEFKPGKMVLDIDSTDHPQCGNLMEGVAWNYKKNWCLDSQVVFNQKGFCHGFDLRAGNTRSGVGADWLLEGSIQDKKSQVKRKFEGKTFIRADSAYCKQDVIKIAVKKGTLFTITANDATTSWKEQVQTQGLSWSPWKHSQKDIERSIKRGRELPEIELSHFYWIPKWSEKQGAKLAFPIIIKRTLNKERFEEIRKRNTQLRMIADDGYLKEDPYDYYAVLTNFPLDLAKEKAHESAQGKVQRYSLQEVMEFHHERANAENFIREEKYSYDLKHFPCLKLNANRAYGLLAMVAHNLLRWVSLMMKPEKPHFSKKLRKRFVFHAGKIVHHARQVYLKITQTGYEEVTKLREAWGFTPERISLRYSSA